MGSLNISRFMGVAHKLLESEDHFLRASCMTGSKLGGYQLIHVMTQ